MIADTHKFKILAISDTHGSNSQLKKLIQNKVQGDFFIHCGDFTRYGRQQSFKQFFKILAQINFKHKIVIAGNHQISLDNNIKQNKKKKFLQKYPCNLSREEILTELKKHCYYLEHQYIEIQGIKFFASPYTKSYGNSAFQYEKTQDQVIWKELPEVDILITHSPPFGINDYSNKEVHAGSEALRKQVFKIKPKLHFFGHIHQGQGQTIEKQIKFYNVAKVPILINYFHKV